MNPLKAVQMFKKLLFLSGSSNGFEKAIKMENQKTIFFGNRLQVCTESTPSISNHPDRIWLNGAQPLWLVNRQKWTGNLQNKLFCSLRELLFQKKIVRLKESASQLAKVQFCAIAKLAAPPATLLHKKFADFKRSNQFDHNYYSNCFSFSCIYLFGSGQFW